MTTSAADLSPERRALLERLMRARGATPPSAGGPSGPAAPGRPAISLFFFSADVDDRAADKYQVVLDCARLADQAGLDAIWVPERHFDRFGAPYPSPALLLAAIAARTERIGLRAGSVVLPLHDPLLVAEEWGMLDAISGGRIALSLASGWHADDFVLDPESYDTRKAVLTGRLAELRRLWSGEALARKGPGGREVRVRTYPTPARQPQIWLTSSGNPQTWRAAGEADLHVLTALLEQTVDDLAAKAGVYRSALAASGHDAAGKQITCMLHTHLAEDPATVIDRVRPPLSRYLAAHMDLFAKFAANAEIGVNPQDVTEADKQILLEHGLRRYLASAGLFGSVETCVPMVERLTATGVTELGCLVDFGLPREQVLECVRELGRLRDRLHATAAR